MEGKENGCYTFLPNLTTDNTNRIEFATTRTPTFH